MATYLPIVDISHHQGRVDFSTMRRRGVRGLILRIGNGDTLDKRAADYYPAAVAAGFDPADLLWYVFVNPKRCGAQRCVEASVEYIRSITGRDDTAIMWDFEHFDREAGTRGPGVIRGAEYANYARTLIAGVDRLGPGWRQFAYSNAAFWDHWVGSHGDDIVEQLDWIVPRYPVHSTAGYDRYPLPGVDGWADWAFARAHSADRARLLNRAPGPFPPRRTDWAGWQFSADFNGQGPVYGCQSSALDLNIVDVEAWARWTNSTTPQPPEIITPPEEITTMDCLYRPYGFTNVFEIRGGVAAPLDPARFAALGGWSAPDIAKFDGARDVVKGQPVARPHGATVQWLRHTTGVNLTPLASEPIQP